MMRPIWKKIIAMGLAISMMVSLTACGGAKDSTGSGSGGTVSAKASTDTSGMIFSTEEMNLEGVDGILSSFVVTQDQIYFLSTVFEDDSEENDDYPEVEKVYSMNKDGSDVKLVCEPTIEDEDEYIRDIILDQEQNVFLLSFRYDQKEESQQCFLLRVGDNGKVAERIDVSQAIGQDPGNYIINICTDEKGDFIVLTGQSVYVLDSRFKKTGEIKNDKGWIEGMTKTTDGKIVCGIAGEEGSTARVLDVEKGEFGENLKLDIEYFGSSDALAVGCGDYDFCYKSDKGIFGYSIKDHASKQILDYVASQINSDYTYGIVPIDAETMVGSSMYNEGGTVIFYKKSDGPLQADGKTVITYGALWGVFDEIKDEAIKFNKESDKYKIEFVDYGESEDAQTKMIADIMAGDAPDILDLSYVPIEPFAGKGILEDLIPYLEKDEVVSKDDLLPSAEKAMEMNGKLYYVSSSFNVKTVLASTKDVGDKTGWTFQELKELLDEKGEGVRPFYGQSKEETLGNFTHSCINDFIDWNTGECRFTSDDFKSILEVAGRGLDEETDYGADAPSEAELISKGQVLFQDGYARMEDLQVFKNVTGTDATYIGYPCEDKNGSYFSFNNQFGIYAKSKVKDGAWEFIRRFLTKEYQAGDGYMFSNPTNKDAFEMYMKSRTATKAYKDEFGHRITPLEESWDYGGGHVNVGPLSPEEEKMYRDLINNTTKVVTFDDTVLEIVKEEAAVYFKGQASIDEAADSIQNRVTTYVNEQR
ncbi:MAG: extracellular solute-binding protein [Lachnospiraceae bacterium]|nr:extracellular solute-binding protein [Lachnospiraceae bacterium]